MASVGRKPKHPDLRVVDGNAARRPIRETVSSHGDPKKPDFISGRARELWDEVLPLLWWLDEVDGHRLGLWCELQAEFEQDPRSMVASRIAQLRAVGSELGMDPASRIRLGALKDDSGKKDEFFDD